MRFVSATGTISRTSSAKLGAVFVGSAAVLSLPTIADMDLTGNQLSIVMIACVVIGGLAFAACALPWERWPRGCLMAWPLTVMIGLTVASFVAPSGSTVTLTGFITLAFFYTGITQRPWTGTAMLPFGVAFWVACYGGWSHPLLLRLPIALGVWVIVSETLSQLQSQVGRLSAELEKEASTDLLTGLASRRTLSGRLDTLAPDDTVVFIDLDNFKTVNDRFGHAAGDQVLADMGATLRKVVRVEDLAVRFGGEELLLILHRTGSEGAITVLERIKATWQLVQAEVTFSAGISLMTVGADPSSVVDAADRALYAAKAAGRNCWMFHQDNQVDEAIQTSLTD